MTRSRQQPNLFDRKYFCTVQKEDCAMKIRDNAGGVPRYYLYIYCRVLSKEVEA